MVGILVDAGTGVTEVDIRAACSVTLLDEYMYPSVNGAVTDHVWCELDRYASDVARLAAESST